MTKVTDFLLGNSDHVLSVLCLPLAHILVLNFYVDSIRGSYPGNISAVQTRLRTFTFIGAPHTVMLSFVQHLHLVVGYGGHQVL